MKGRPVCLIVRDGWGYNENPQGNAVMAAKTPVIDSLKKEYPWCLLDVAGEAVGLPDGYQGSSEVGHLNMGAGRIVTQELKRLNDGFSKGLFFEAQKWKDLISRWRTKSGQLHLFGLLQDEGVHAHQDHLFKIMHRAREEFKDGSIVIHPFLDGRDTSPRSCLGYLSKLSEVMAQVGNCRIGTVMGRYYAMDRSKNWGLTDIAYNCIVTADGRRASSAEQAVKESYEKDKTVDNVEMFDEYIPPYSLDNYEGVRDGDCIIHTNYRQDRAIQLSMAFVETQYPGDRAVRPDVAYLGLTRYYDEFEEYLLQAMNKGGGMKNLLGEVISKAGIKQLRISETQKYRHVTSFFNGKTTTPYPGEDDVEIPSRFDPATFASHPEMEAYNLTDELLARIRTEQYSFILVNYANGDMVGHTGNYDAAKKAIEIVDECIGKVVKELTKYNVNVLITSDHGNSEQMVEYDTGLPKTSHTTFPVELILVTKDDGGKKIVPKGKLSDIGPTVLRLLELPIPDEMTADVLVRE
ncbi:MAG: 2,3-bisphosphoglycerate-independent phosphoglycerate mutase [Proteobacteria bacterium]|nr:2,3-bisphosphoglycerate-independent phosphoglycerate mutase [Pseudomonadota bacterium]